MHLIRVVQESGTDWTSPAQIAEHLTLVGALVLAIWSFMREHIVTGRQYRRTLKQNTLLLNLAFRLQGLAKTGTEIAFPSSEDGER